MKSLITPPNKATKVSTQNHKETQNFMHLKTFFAEFCRKNSSRKNSNSKAKSKKRVKLNYLQLHQIRSEKSRTKIIQKLKICTK